MSILGNILSRILGRPAAAADPVAASPGAAVPAADALSPNGQAMGAGAAAPGSPAPATSPAMPMVDVEAVLAGMAGAAGQPLNWKTSIVDLMKLVGLDSSLAARKELAGELHYSGDTNDSAAMNMWLHRQVMQKLAANGGRLPANLAA